MLPHVRLLSLPERQIMQQPPTEDTGGAAGELRSDAQQLTSKAANRIHSEVDARKGNAADQAKSVSNAIQTAAGQLDESAPTWLKSAFQQGADQIQRFAETIEQKDSRQIVNEVQNFARERPALFLGACAAAGFAAARIFKAGGEEEARNQSVQTGPSDVDQPWGASDDALGSQSTRSAQQFDELSDQLTSAGGTVTPASPRGEFV
jgi:ElaB/YqjD/DUF883 family membrane-anchored ribosome-binding protein